MEETSDGFQVAEADLRNRGGGDLAGRAQSGHSSLTNGNHIWELPRDSQTVLAARTAAEQFLNSYGYDVDKWPAFLQETLNDPSVVDLDVHELPNLQ
jgi:RecG-like helicase